MIQALSFTATVLMLMVFVLVLWASVRPEPKPETPAHERAAARLGAVLSRLLTEKSPAGNAVRAATEDGGEKLACAVSLLPPEVLANMTEEQLRNHIVRCSRFAQEPQAYREGTLQ